MEPNDGIVPRGTQPPKARIKELFHVEQSDPNGRICHNSKLRNLVPYPHQQKSLQRPRNGHGLVPLPSL